MLLGSKDFEEFKREKKQVNTILIKEDAFKFEYSKIGKVDIIVSSPPYFHKSIHFNPFGATAEEHVGKLHLLFKKIIEITGASQTLIQYSNKAFVIMRGTMPHPFRYQVNLVNDSDNLWSHIHEQDAFSIASRTIIKPVGKIVLDPFCGSGTWLYALKHMGASKLIGIDNNEDQLRRVRA